MRYVFYVNPVAGKGNTQERIIESIKKFFSDKAEQFKIHITKSKGDALISAKQEAETGDNIRMFACGGEGTVFEVLNGIAGYTNIELGVIPCGSANDFLKYFNTKEEFLDISEQVNGTAVEMDLIKAGDRYCLNGCSVGMDAMVARDMAIFKNWPFVSGKMAYTLAIIKTLLKRLGVKIKLSIDNGIFRDTNCLFAVIANAPYYGGGYKGAPDAVPNDQALDCTVVDTVSKFKILELLPIYKKGEHKKLDICSLSRCESMEFTSEKPIPVNLDGEIIETTHIKFQLVKKAVKFVLPTGIANKMLTKV
ncbi:MAG: YegS/Rv2252/BmrU family lipid kinase [Clostridia bacterium]|nr:YegS/Rv2252/BmrU family lipid kinase [Clostridia bacterium]